MNKFNELKQLIADLESDANEFFKKNNKAAGTRTRVGLQKLKALASDIRVEVLNLQKKPK